MNSLWCNVHEEVHTVLDKVDLRLHTLIVQHLELLNELRQLGMPFDQFIVCDSVSLKQADS